MGSGTGSENTPHTVRTTPPPQHFALVKYTASTSRLNRLHPNPHPLSCGATYFKDNILWSHIFEASLSVTITSQVSLAYAWLHHPDSWRWRSLSPETNPQVWRIKTKPLNPHHQYGSAFICHVLNIQQSICIFVLGYCRPRAHSEFTFHLVNNLMKVKCHHSPEMLQGNHYK